ncbi:MAG: rRNA maturation RNase YbeY [Rubripirellula sp.]
MSNILDNNPPEEILIVEITIDDSVSDCDEVDGNRFRQAVLAAAAERDFHRGEIGIRVTDDPSIHEINRDHLGHDYPTDVISFAYACQAPTIEGALVVSVDTARQKAAELGWSSKHELLLYVVHGVLHIAGMDDHEPNDRAAMRAAERSVLTTLGIKEIENFSPDQPATTGDQA